jgi:beta-mannosidase
MCDTNVLMNAECQLNLEAQSAQELSANELLGRFFDVNYAYRFGPPAHDVNVTVLKDSATSEVLATAYHFPQAYELQSRDIALQVSVVDDQSGWCLDIKSSRLAIFVHIIDEHYRAEDNWFHLAANMEKRIRLIPRSSAMHKPHGEIWALNSETPIRFRGAD